MRVRAVCITRKTEKKDEKRNAKLRGKKGEKERGGGESGEGESVVLRQSGQKVQGGSGF